MPIRWSIPEEVPALAPSHVHVWKASVDELAIYHDRFLPLLDVGERDRHARFHFARDAGRFAVSHGLLRALLSRYIGEPPEALQFAEGPHGKPYLCRPAALTVSFNMSHSDDVILVALARDCNVGVDVERWQEGLEMEEMSRIAEFAFSSREQNRIRELPDRHRAQAFFSLWARKEAYIKSTGIGITQGLDHFDISCAPDEAQLIADRRTSSNVHTWKLIDLELPVGYSGALAVDRPSIDLHTFLATPTLAARWCTWQSVIRDG